MMPMPIEEGATLPIIKVVGIGGGGGNTVTRMMQAEVRGIEFITINTDAQALERTAADRRVRIGETLTKGLGAGGHPEVGMKAAEENADQIFEILRDSNMVFITAGMGGGTGTGAAPVVAQIAKEAGALTVAVVTKPFAVEGHRRRQNAEEGIAKLKDKVDALIVIPNDRLLQVVDKKTSVESSFKIADEVLHQGIQGIAEIITVPGLMNRDFADVKSILAQAGSALMAIGRAEGDDRATEAAKAAIASPLLEVSINGAKGVLINFTGGPDMTLFELTEAADLIAKVADPEANIIMGAVIDPRMEGEIKITLIATGFDGKPALQPKAGSLAKPVQIPSPAATTQIEEDILTFLKRRA
jgi:cell division protein FtsZ